MKTATVLLSLICLALLAGPATAASSRPDTAAIIQDVLYAQVDAAITSATEGTGALKVWVIDEVDPDDLLLSSAELPLVEGKDLQPLEELEPAERLRRMIRVLRSLPFKTRQEQINELLATVHTLPV